MGNIYKPHPKPLSEAVLAGRYSKLGLSEKKLEFLHKFFTAAANLYGLIELVELVRVYRELGKVLKDNIYWQRQYVKGITKTDFCRFSDVSMRDGSRSYKLYDSIELFCDGNENAANRFLIAGELIGKGRGRLQEVYKIMDNLNNSEGYCVPEDLLEYVEPKEAAEIGELREILRGLKSEAEEIPEDSFSIRNVYVTNKYKGQCLKDVFARAEGDLIFNLFYGKPENMPPMIYDVLFDEQGQSRNYADKLLKYFIYDTDSGRYDQKNALQVLFENIGRVGAEDHKDEYRKLVELCQFYNNNVRMRTKMGWKPVELALRMYNPGQMPVMQFGPGIKKLFESGQWSEEEFKQMVAENNNLSEEAKQMLLDAMEKAIKERE